MNIILNEVKNKELVIDIIGSIGQSIMSDGFDVKQLKAKLDAIEYEIIILNVSSLGGSAYEGLNIYSMLEFEKSKGKKVICNIIGAVASAAATICMAGNEINMLEDSIMLIHKVSGQVKGKTENMEEQIRQMKALNENLIQIYASKSGLDKEFISNLLDSEKWLSAKDALKYNLITNIIKNSKIKNINMENIINQINESELPKVEVVTDVVEEVKDEVIVTEEVKSESVEQEITQLQDVVNEPIIEVVDEIKNDYENKINSLNLIIEEKDSKIVELTNKINLFEKLQKDSEIETILINAIKQNKIGENVKENYRKLLLNNFDDTKDLIKNLTPVKNFSLINLIEEKPASGRESWTIRDWEIKDSKGLKELKENNIEKYKKLYDAFYKKVE